SRRRHTRWPRDWSSDVCSSDLNEEWVLLAMVVRYHRGTEPSDKSGPFSKLSTERQNRVRALAGVLRLALALRKCGVETGAGLHEIGRASCRERGESSEGGVCVK